MDTATTSTVIGLFQSRAAAEQAVNALVNANISRERVSVVAADRHGQETEIPNIAPVDSPGSFDAGTGAAVGGLAGFVGGILALAIPGIGPILAAGPLAAGIMGAGLGAATGGLIGGLKQHGVPENDAARVSEAVRHGRVMVAAHVPEDRAADVADIMDDYGALDKEHIEDTPLPSGGEATSFRPLSSDAVEAARLQPGEGLVDRQRERGRRAQVYPGITGAGSMPNA